MDATRRRILDITAWLIGLFMATALLAHAATAGGIVKSAASCASCHTSVQVTDFRERNIRLPR